MVDLSINIINYGCENQHMKLRNKVVLITGASKGIGKATAFVLAREGAKVIVNYHTSRAEAASVVRAIKKIGSEATAIQCDVSREKEVKSMIMRAVKTFGKIDILINNAGGYIDGDEWNGTMDVWEKTFHKNVLSTMLVSKYVSERFIKQKSGIIVNIASRQATFPRPDALAYGAAKAGIVNITQSYAKVLAPFGRANVISPSTTNAGYWLTASKQELKASVVSMPLGRIIEPEEIAAGVLFLVSDDSAMITGQNILIDGGKEK